MREYGQIQSAFWQHHDTVSLSDTGKLLATYLLTGPHTNALGCFRVPDGYVMGDLGWSSETVSKGFTELFENGFLNRCETTHFVLIRKFLRWNPIQNGNVAKARAKEFEDVPRNFQYISDLVSVCERFGNHWPKGFERVLDDRRKGYTKSNPTQPYPEPTLTEPPQDPLQESISVDCKPNGASYV